jgi:DinB superfamily
MKHILYFALLTLAISIQSLAQDTRLWNEEDRKYLLENLVSTRDQLVKETAGLTTKQWNFKETPTRWSIKEVVEHIDLWELLLQREISMALTLGPQPELAKTAKPDSVVLGFIMEEKPHVSTDYTKPFTFTLPMGLNEGKNSAAWFLKMRNESIEYLTSVKEDLRYYFQRAGRGNIHQVYIITFGHNFRHLRQIQKIKQHPNYPK